MLYAECKRSPLIWFHSRPVQIFIFCTFQSITGFHRANQLIPKTRPTPNNNWVTVNLPYIRSSQLLMLHWAPYAQIALWTRLLIPSVAFPSPSAVHKQQLSPARYNIAKLLNQWALSTSFQRCALQSWTALYLIHSYQHWRPHHGSHGPLQASVGQPLLSSTNLHQREEC